MNFWIVFTIYTLAAWFYSATQEPLSYGIIFGPFVGFVGLILTLHVLAYLLTTLAHWLDPEAAKREERRQELDHRLKALSARVDKIQ